MSRIISEIIRSKVAADAIDATAAANLVALIHDALPADAGLDAVDKAIAQAREGFSPLFRRPAPKPQAEPQAKQQTEPQRRVLSTVAGAYSMRQAHR